MAVFKSLWLLAACAASCALAQSTSPISSFCSETTNVCVGINIPSSGSDTYFSVSAPTGQGWVGFGIGDGMAGALIFVTYPNESGNNVTVSPRVGEGYVQPLYESSIQITMLDGSGISGDTMTANFVCKNCRSWSGGTLDTTAKDQGFLWAIGGSSQNIASNEKDVTIRQHSQKDRFTLDVASATGGVGGNPFSAGSEGPSSSDSRPGSSVTGGGGATNSGGAARSTPASSADKAIIAHGVIMAFTWLLMFPFGAALIRMLGQPLIVHRIVQSAGFLLAITAMILAIYASGENKTHFTYFHQYFGVVLVSLLLVQAVLGQLHHMEYVKTGKRSLWSYGHIWFGRTVIVCAIINGGIGLSIVETSRGKASPGQKAAYAIIAVLVAITYAAGYWWTQMRNRR